MWKVPGESSSKTSPSSRRDHNARQLSGCGPLRALVLKNACFFSCHRGGVGAPYDFDRGAVVDLSIQNNEIFANVGIQAVPVAGDAIDDGAPQIAIADLYICHNHMFCDLFGVSLEPFVLLLGETDISDNFIHGSIGNIRVVGVTAAGAPVDIARNSIRTTGDGIVLAVDGARVHDNDITAVRLGQDGNGIVLTEVPGNENGIDCCQVVGNCIADLGGTGISSTHMCARS